MSCACDLSSAAGLRQFELSRQHCGSGESQLCQGQKAGQCFLFGAHQKGIHVIY